MKCAWVQDRLLLYLAGEMEPKETAKLLKHLEQCNRCAAVAEELAETREAARQLAQTNVVPPVSLDARVIETVRNLPARRLPWSVGLPYWNGRRVLALAAATVALIALGFWAGSQYLSGSWIAATAEQPMLNMALLSRSHREHLAPLQAPEIPSSAARQMAQSLSPRVQFPVALVNLKGAGARLVGGGGLQIQGVPVALLCYQWNGECVSLFQMDAMKLRVPALRQMPHSGPCYVVGKIDNFAYVVWCSGKTNFVMIARVRPEQLFALARRAGESLEPS